LTIEYKPELGEYCPSRVKLSKAQYKLRNDQITQGHSVMSAAGEMKNGSGTVKDADV
jgi:hypothetical protein